MPTTLAREIRRRRKEMGLSQAQLSAKIGRGATYIRDIESGKSRDPRSRYLARIAAVLGCTVEALNYPQGAADLSPTNIGRTRADLLQRGYALADRLIEEFPRFGNREISRHRIGAAIHDVLLRREEEGRPITADDRDALDLIYDTLRVWMREAEE